MNNKTKISIIGAGNIGGTIAFELSQREDLSIVLLDRNEGRAKGKALDIMQAREIAKVNASIIGTSKYEDIANSSAIIVTAGVPRKPGMSREDLLKVNAKAIIDIANEIKQYAQDAFIIVITNPLDAMVHLMQKVTGFHPKKVVGMAGILDTARFSFFLREKMNIASNNISSLVLGGHGDGMVPMLANTSISGMTLLEAIKAEYISQTDVDILVSRTKNGGAEIVSLLETGSAFYAPAIAAIKMLYSYLLDSKEILPCAVKLNGEYGINNLYFGAPAIIGANGVEKIIELQVDLDTTKLIKESSDSVRKVIKEVDAFLKDLENFA